MYLDFRHYIISKYSFLMDIIYHGNCLDGIFSSFSMFVFLNLVKFKYKDKYQLALESLLDKVINKSQVSQNEVILDQEDLSVLKKQQFYLYDKVNKFTSIAPGYFTTGLINYIQKTSNNRYVALVDCYGETLQKIEYLCSKYKHVFVIDHHVSGVDILAQVKCKNITIIFNQNMCAFQLVNEFLQKNFHFHKMCLPEFYNRLRVFEKYIRKNDLKLGQTIESKQFILGYYHFNLVMSDTNFMIYKQLSNLDIDYILDKGRKIYPYHRAKLVQYASNPLLISFVGKKISIRFLGVKINEPQYISDLGIILSEMSCNEGYQNISMLYKMNGTQVRVSFRSRRGRKNPRALQLAQLFGGGGHLCAAGCRIPKNVFLNSFGVAQMKVSKLQNIQGMLFGQNNGEN